MTGTTRSRLPHLDWLRGVAVLIMIGAHSFDAWTRPDEKGRIAYGWLMMIGGMGAPAFLFLAGTAAALAAGAHMARGASPQQAAIRVERRGWQVLGYAFLFRLQSFLLGGFARPQNLLKVDILNVMGPSIAAVAAFWRLPAGRRGRALMLSAGTLLVVLLTPAIRTAPWLGVLPDPVEWYFRPDPGKGTFTLFPWSGFVLAGAVLGVAIDGARQGWSVARLHVAIALSGLALIALGYWASLQPPVFRDTQFWTTSPTFFCMRLGLLVSAVAAAWAWSVRPWRQQGARSALETLGVGSLFVYWVHVELVYGGAGQVLRGRLTLEQGAVAWTALVAFMFGLLQLWTSWRPARSRVSEPRVTAVKSEV